MDPLQPKNPLVGLQNSVQEGSLSAHEQKNSVQEGNLSGQEQNNSVQEGNVSAQEFGALILLLEVPKVAVLDLICVSVL